MVTLSEVKYTGTVFSVTPLKPGVNVGLPEDVSDTGPTVVAAYGGRVFFSGMGAQVKLGDSLSPQYNSYLFFSPSMSSIDKLPDCFQEADPTSEHISDLIDTDGGFIPIAELGTCVAMKPIGNALIIFGDNGVWEILGGTTGFSATAFSIRKITDVGTTSGESVVAVEGFIVYWADGGIYIITPDEASGQFQSSNITEQTIQSFYNEISSSAKGSARGKFDSRARQIRWMYNDDPLYDGVTNRNQSTKELVFDTVLRAFYPSTITPLATNSPFMSDYIETPGIVATDEIFTIVVGADPVVVGFDPVIHTQVVSAPVATELKYFTTQNRDAGNQFFTFSSFRNSTFLDWPSHDGVGVDAPAFLLTGYELFEDTQRDKQIPYLTVHCERTEDGWELDINSELILTNQSSCLVQAQWQWTTSANAGRFGRQFQAYRLQRYYQPQDVSDPFDYSFSVITTKNKLRGKGSALSLLFSTEAGKDLRLLGWAKNVSGNTEV